MLSVAVDGTLILFNIYREREIVWLRVGAFDLNLLGGRRLLGLIRVWLGEKRGTLFILEAPLWRVHKLDTETGAMEDIADSFHCDVLLDAVPMETD
jgi:hypothetical protein